MKVILDLDAEHINNLMGIMAKMPFEKVFKIMPQLHAYLEAAHKEETGESLHPQQAPVPIPTAPVPPPAPEPIPPAPVPPTPPAELVIKIPEAPEKGNLKGFCRVCACLINQRHYREDSNTYDCTNCGNRQETPTNLEEIEKEATHTSKRKAGQR